MKHNRLVQWLAASLSIALGALLLVSVQSCKDIEGPTGGTGGTQQQSAVIEGVIYGKIGTQAAQPLPGARVSLLGSFFALDTLTDGQGFFHLDIVFPSDAPQTDQVFLTVRKSDFISKADTFNIQRGSSIKGNSYTLIAIDTSTVIIVTGTGKAGSIVLDSLTTNKISVQGTGANVTATVTFVVKDRSGNPLQKDSALVRFSLTGVSNSATLQPNAALTDTRGRVRTTVTSGTIAGVVQVVAITDTAPGFSLKSTPIPITISGGLPDSSHFGIAVQKFNIPGIVTFGLTDVITVFVGDRYGNPVPEHTAVYFTTNGGIIQSSAFTNADGISSVTLFSGEPIPPGGLAAITASTVDESGDDIRGTAHVVFSGSPIVSANPDPLVVNDGSATTLNYTVQDLNGNAMSAGQTYKVSLEGGTTVLNELELSGDVNITMLDGLAGGTSFAVTVRDKNPLNLTQGSFTVVIQVDGPNRSVKHTVPGQLLPSLNPPVRVVLLESVTNRRITVRNTGEIDTTTLVFVLKDDQDRVIPVPNVPVDFLFSGATGSFTPPRGLTDATGHVRTTFHSGSDTGTVNITAQVGEVTSRPVAITILPGPPFLLKLTANRSDSVRVNFPGAASGNNGVQLGDVRVEVKDRYGNPIAPGSRILSFATNAGTFPNSSAYTSLGGIAKVDWYGGLPFPPSGSATITASTTGENGAPISKSITVTYSGDPAISTTLPPNFVLPSGVDTSIVFTVNDGANANPLAQGENIQVTSSGANSVLLTGDINVTMQDTRDQNLTRFTVRLRDTNTVVIVNRIVSLTVQATGPNGTQRFTVSGTLLGAIPPPFKVIVLESISATTLSVTGVGASDSSRLTYVLQDSAGHQIRKSGVPVLFFVASGVDGNFNPQTGLTDADGRVSTTFHSGTFSGTSTVKAQSSGIQSQGQNITIEGGPPSQIYFSLKMLRPGDTQAKVNFPGAFATLRQQIGTAQVVAKDRYGNPAKPRTLVNFTSTAGSLQTTAYTDNNGLVQADWFGGTPIPAGGSAHIVASTLGEAALVVSDSADVLYSGQAIITGGLASGLVFHQGIDTVVSYRVSDANGHPLAQGATIQVTASGAAAGSVVLSGNVNVTMPDTSDTNATFFSFRLRDTNTVISGNRDLLVTIQVAGPNGTATQAAADTLQGSPPPTVSTVNLVSVSAFQLVVKNSNGVETSVLTYELLDEVGNPVRRSGVTIVFAKNGVPGSFTPETTLTDGNGQVQTTFHSDTVAGVVQVFARAVSLNIQSAYVKLSIVGGKPDQAHFTLVVSAPNSTTQRVNYPGAMPIVQQIGEAHVIAGDRYGNPCPAGTPVYFTSNAGVIQGKAFTDGNGFGQVSWFGGNPLPTGGVATIQATTLGVNGTTVTTSAQVLYTGQAIITGGPPANFTIPGGGVVTYNYRIYDANRNPISAGSTITVTASGVGASALVLSGDFNVTSPDTRDTDKTYFSVTVQDTSTFSSTNRDVRLTIAVDGPNGSASNSADGTVLTTGSGGRTRFPGSIALISNSTNDIQVIGTGGTETATIIWEIRDSLGVPVDSSYKVRFSFSSTPGGGAFISPDSGFNDAQTGRISSVVHSGSISGVLQIVATVVGPSGNIVSTPVRILIHAGLPDQAHFTIFPSVLNVGPAFVVDGLEDPINVVVGDVYGNPVAQNTAVYFTTRMGVVTTNTGFTDIDGRASVKLISGNPRTADGFGYVVAKTVGVNGTPVTDSVKILFSGRPLIDSVTVTPPSGDLTDSTVVTVRFRVYDVNHNPLAAGTNIVITVQGASVVASPVQPAATLPDTQSPYYTEFTATLSEDLAAIPFVTGNFTATISVTGPNGTANQQFTGTSR
ncbi:MAG: hypothetical protein HY033_08075 [Ignavibacteriae bacterium]|nr:hypothetical protein [Ignavibacteria bacterium]MBI3364849.1 hypothetical protein [Ignavibacteriota bacterium]